MSKTKNKTHSFLLDYFTLAAGSVKRNSPSSFSHTFSLIVRHTTFRSSTHSLQNPSPAQSCSASAWSPHTGSHTKSRNIPELLTSFTCAESARAPSRVVHPGYCNPHTAIPFVREDPDGAAVTSIQSVVSSSRTVLRALRSAEESLGPVGCCPNFGDRTSS